MSEDTCREIMTKERLYEYVNDSIRKSEILIIKEDAKLSALRHIKRNLDEYFEDLNMPNQEDYPSPRPTWYCINHDERSAICPCCHKSNLMYGDFCKWCGAKVNEPIDYDCTKCKYDFHNYKACNVGKTERDEHCLNCHFEGDTMTGFVPLPKDLKIDWEDPDDDF